MWHRHHDAVFLKRDVAGLVKIEALHHEVDLILVLPRAPAHSLITYYRNLEEQSSRHTIRIGMQDICSKRSRRDKQAEQTRQAM